jgi:hypothetical protein
MVFYYNKTSRRNGGTVHYSIRRVVGMEELSIIVLDES